MQEFAARFSVETATVCERWPEAGIFGEIEHRAAGTPLRVLGTPYQEIEPGLSAGRGAHRAGLEGDIEGAFLEAPITEHTASFAQRQYLRVTGRVRHLLATIAGTGQDLAGAGHDRPYRNLPSPRGVLGLGYGLGHKGVVGVVEDPVRKHEAEDSTGGQCQEKAPRNPGGWKSLILGPT